MSRAASVLMLVAVLAGCDKEQPAAALPIDPAPKVVVEDPGQEPGDAPPPEPIPDEASGRTEIVVGDSSCQSDADCVKATCCHATACVAVGQQPDCSSTMCTADCKSGTTDCNGGCLCQDGKCAAKLWWPPET